MGRNADKRKERKHKRDTKVQEERAVHRTLHAARAVTAGQTGHDLPSGLADTLMAADGRAASELLESLSGALFRLTSAVTAEALRGDDHSGLTFIAREIAAVLEVDTVSLALLVDEALGDGGRRSSLRLIASQRRLSSDERLLTFHADDELAGEVLRTAEPLLIEDAPRDPRFSRAYGQRSDIGSLLIVPLAYGGRLLGVLAVSRKEVGAFFERDVRTLTIVARSVAEDLEQSKQLSLAFTDPLTGLLGRQALLWNLPREIERSRRYGIPLSLSILRVEGLNDVASRFGVQVADVALRELGQRIGGALRGADLGVRFGVDSFVLVAPVSIEEMKQASTRHMDALLASPVILGDVEIPLEVSASVVQLDTEDIDAFSLLLRAEQELSAPQVAARASSERVSGPKMTLEQDDRSKMRQP